MILCTMRKECGVERDVMRDNMKQMSENMFLNTFLNTFERGRKETADSS